mgnify:CR=1 FL=1
MKFKLFDENSNSYKGEILLDFSSVYEYLDWSYSNDNFRVFMDSMESGPNSWNGIHDGGNGYEEGDVEFWSYSSYEIKDFDAAIKKWEEFFTSEGKILNN